MLPIAFAALLGLALGRFFKAAALAPGVVATTGFAAFVAWSNEAGLAASLAAIVLAAACLQLGYLVGSTTAHPLARAHPRRPSAPAKLSADL